MIDLFCNQKDRIVLDGREIITIGEKYVLQPLATKVIGDDWVEYLLHSIK